MKNIAEVSLKLMKLVSMICLRIYSVLICLLIYTSLHSQTVRIGTIDVYGNRKIPSDTILRHAQISAGDSISQKMLLNRSIERSIRAIKGIRLVKTALVCCDKNGNYHLFIGVAETDTSILAHRKAPTLRIKLPQKYSNAYAHFSERLSDAVQAGQAGDDWNQGHSLIHYAPGRKIQEKYRTWADEDFQVLSKVLRSSAYAAQRATAAQIIAYHFDKNRVVPELMYALIDESDEVRNTATRALAVIAYYAAKHPEKKIKVPYTPFIRLINSVVWSDRNKGLSVLKQLTLTRNAEALSNMKELSLPALKEMAVWKSEVHAMPAYIILARIAGEPEDRINRLASDTNFANEAAKLADSIK
jgi:hypothetical protein